MELSLIPVQPDNRRTAEALSVGPGQEHFIETVSECLSEADHLSDWEPVMILRGKTPVGFAMYGYIHCDHPPRVWFDRFLIDRHYQHQGLGREAAQVILSQLHREFPGQDIYLSAYEDNPIAIRLYQSFGFQFNGELDLHGEKVMVLKV